MKTLKLPLKIEITQEHIDTARMIVDADAGVSAYSVNPVFLAIHRLGSKFTFLTDSSLSIELPENTKWWFKTSLKVQRFFSDFKNKKQVKPFTLILTRKELSQKEVTYRYE